MPRRTLVIICPDCGGSAIFELGESRTTVGGFNSRCGTSIDFQVDSRNSAEPARRAALAAGVTPIDSNIIPVIEEDKTS